VLLPLLSLGLMVVSSTLSDTPVLLSGRSETTGLTTLVNGVADPVDASITTDRLVVRVDEDDLVVLVDTVLVDPVRVQNSESSTSTSDTFLGGRTERTLELEVVDTLVGGLTEGGTYMSIDLDQLRAREEQRGKMREAYPCERAFCGYHGEHGYGR